MKTRQLVFCSLIVALVLWAGLGWAQQPKYGGTLRLALAGDMTFFNAHQGPAPGGHTYWVWNNIFKSLSEKVMLWLRDAAPSGGSWRF